nr:hypothetical protein [uncultured bacterium]
MTAGELVGKITRRKLLVGTAAAFVTAFLPPIEGIRRAVAGGCGCGSCCCVNFVDVWCYCDCCIAASKWQNRYCVTEDWCCTDGCESCYQNPGYCLFYCNQCFQLCPGGYNCTHQFVSSCFSLQCKVTCA